MYFSLSVSNLLIFILVFRRIYPAVTSAVFISLALCYVVVKCLWLVIGVVALRYWKYITECHNSHKHCQRHLTSEVFNIKKMFKLIFNVLIIEIRINFAASWNPVGCFIIVSSTAGKIWLRSYNFSCYGLLHRCFTCIYFLVCLV